MSTIFNFLSRSKVTAIGMFKVFQNMVKSLSAAVMIALMFKLRAYITLGRRTYYRPFHAFSSAYLNLGKLRYHDNSFFKNKYYYGHRRLFN